MLYPVELPLCLRFPQCSCNMLANFPGNRACDKPTDQQNDGVESDIGLRGRRWPTRSGRNPAEVNSCSEIAGGRRNPTEPADPPIETQDGKHDEDEKEQRCGTCERAVSRFEILGREECHPDAWSACFEHRTGNPQNAREFAVVL